MYAKGGYKRAGVEMTYRQQISLADTEADFTSTCRQAVSLKVDLIAIAASGTTIQAAAAACKKAGYKGAYSTSGLAVDKSQASDANLNGHFYVPTSTFPFSDASTPARKEFQTVMQRYAPDVALSGAASQAWTAAKLFEAVVANLKGKDVTTANLLAAARTLPPTDLGGLTGTLHFGSGNQPAQPCTGLLFASGGAFVPGNGGKLNC
jgi:ABC-type branched-subunit amino acid transport system substrate-binding protein